MEYKGVTEYTINDYDTAPASVKAFFDMMGLLAPDVKIVAPPPMKKGDPVYRGWIWTDQFVHSASAGKALAVSFLDSMAPLGDEVAIMLSDIPVQKGRDPATDAYPPKLVWEVPV